MDEGPMVCEMRKLSIWMTLLRPPHVVNARFEKLGINTHPARCDNDNNIHVDNSNVKSSFLFKWSGCASYI